ncbi:MAG: pyridoxal-phosphate dependent enzyme [Methylococcaceae bacterium]|nr:pyridoxal-phosphate dependent enzyme [Methylococcaceae bacterium]
MHPALASLESIFTPSPLTKIAHPLLDQQQIELWLKRDDMLHPIVSGNKWRKLKYVLDHALCIGADTLVSMGGAYSNHLHALAYVGRELGLKTIGLIRSEPGPSLTPTLTDLQQWGMELKFVTRTHNRLLRHYRDWQAFPGLQPKQYWLPEGGAQAPALQGVAEIVAELDIDYDMLCVPCGTGTTLAGLISAAPPQVSVIGFAALKNAGFLINDVATILPQQYDNWQINLDYHFGGFASTTAELMTFIADFERQTAIELDPVYTGKMMFGLFDLIAKQQIKSGQRIIAVHTGGLQGKRGFNS